MEILKYILSVLTLSPVVCMAVNPATKEYVDAQFSFIQQQINQIQSSGSVSHPVGSCYGGGIVFYVNTTPNASAGQQGLIVALTDATTPSILGIYIPSMFQLHGYFTGSTNTSDAISFFDTNAPPASTSAPGFYNASVYNGGGFNDWYLPAVDELMTLFAQSDSSGSSFWSNCSGTAPLSVAYWSSTYSATNGKGYAVNFSTGLTELDFTSASGNHIRAIRAF